MCWLIMFIEYVVSVKVIVDYEYHVIKSQDAVILRETLFVLDNNNTAQVPTKPR